ncbi:2-amino-4-hydroxy-6-hydroxymethyldihydropteridine diphosphokinase [Acinetobacter populi]|uniref:2-amino-4-hydroxy-6- hydroxymethyldihydropteridine diphosphokinase n=1 Tax=Acinetobacter populi TaxID=1582270 RepID=UPI001FE3CC66|nr:2-amino-4-hydroxy-6-hydroxymethyldihydropteridine diphosphokinase [Acinetobacter populi]
MTIYAIAIASNLDKIQNTQFALTALKQLGTCQISPIYEIPCRDGVGADYWNAACLVDSQIELNELLELLKTLEAQTGRKRPSHSISLDIDLIAFGQDLSAMQFNPKKMPLAVDVIIPLATLWHSKDLPKVAHQYKTIDALI